MEVRLDTVEIARSETLELVNTCKALQGFDTIQIMSFLPSTWMGRVGLSSSEQLNQGLRERVNGVRDVAIDCLKRPGTGWGKGRKKATVRVIELSPDHPKPHLGSVKVEEYGV